MPHRIQLPHGAIATCRDVPSANGWLESVLFVKTSLNVSSNNSEARELAAAIQEYVRSGLADRVEIN
ncbi:MAG: hypothetical protein AB3N28_11835 [Kordiimonas sp.]